MVLLWLPYLFSSEANGFQSSKTKVKGPDLDVYGTCWRHGDRLFKKSSQFPLSRWKWRRIPDSSKILIISSGPLLATSEWYDSARPATAVVFHCPVHGEPRCVLRRFGVLGNSYGIVEKETNLSSCKDYPLIAKISHLWKRKIIFPANFEGDILW